MKVSLILLCCLLGFLSEFGFLQVTSIKRIGKPVPKSIICRSITLKNGVVKRRSPRARAVRFTCNRGYILAGQKISTCLRNGKWDPVPPKCIRPTCKSIGPRPNEDNLLVYPTHGGALQYFYCKSGYSLNGPRDIYCDGSQWSNSVPRCLPVNTTAKLSCDFEDTDLCGWTHDLNHDFDWTRENFNTPSGSIGTGPAFDHTKGVGEDGHYMYIESSSRAENDTARLVSPVYDKVDGDVCFEFYYHMFGATIGTLRVYLKTVSEPWTLNSETAIFSKSGNQGDKWFRSMSYLGRINDEFQIVIEGVRGAGYVSDIAIDDVKIILNCTIDEETTTMMESSTYNELIPTVDSCEARCGQIEQPSQNNYHLTCDCDDDCFGNNRCCPDYYDICTGGTTSTDDFDTTIISEENTRTEKYNSLETNFSAEPTIIPDTTEEKIYAQETTTTRFYTPKTNPQFINITSTMPVIKFVTTSMRPVTLPAKSTTTHQKALTTQVLRISTKKTTDSDKKPILYFHTPPSTPSIYRKIIATTTSPRITPFVYMRKTTTTYKEKNTIGDAIDVPRPTKSDEGEYISDNGKEFWPNENPYRTNFSETNKLFSQSYVESANSHFAIIGVSLTCTVIIISIVLVVFIRKYKRTRGIMSSNGESQSDVRFLTEADEIDFSLPVGYDD